MSIGANASPGNLIGIWRVGCLIHQTKHHQLHLAQPADSSGSNRWPYVIRIGGENQRMAVRTSLSVAEEVSHPGLISIVDGSADAGVPYLIMPRMTVDQSGAVTDAMPVVLWAARQVAQTLAAMHRSGWVHGDVRPGHVLGNPMGHTMLIDLGSAARVHSTRTSAAMLDRGFASPEAIRSDHAAVAGMDVFSLGRTLWSWMLSVRGSDSELKPVATLIEKMLEANFAKRPAMTEVVDSLAELELKSLERSISPGRVDPVQISPKTAFANCRAA